MSRSMLLLGLVLLASTCTAQSSGPVAPPPYHSGGSNRVEPGGGSRTRGNYSRGDSSRGDSSRGDSSRGTGGPPTPSGTSKGTLRTYYYTVRLTSGLTGRYGQASIKSTLMRNFNVPSSQVIFTSSSSSSSSYLKFRFSSTTLQSVKFASGNLNELSLGTCCSQTGYKTKYQLGFYSVSASYYTNLAALVTGLATLLLVIIIGSVVAVCCCIACCVFCCIRQSSQAVVVQQQQPGYAQTMMQPQMMQPQMMQQPGQVQQGYAPQPQQGMAGGPMMQQPGQVQQGYAPQPQQCGDGTL